MSSTTPTPTPYTGSPGFIMSFLSTSFVSWLLIGAIGYRDASFGAGEALVAFTIILSIVFFVTLIFAVAELDAASSRRGGVFYTAGITGLGVSASYAMVSAGWNNGQHRLFWALGGLFGGLLLEISTGVFTLCSRSLERGLARTEKKGQ